MIQKYKDSLELVTGDIEKSGQKNVKLLIVSKAQTCESINQVYKLGYKIFGENYLQEAKNKITELKLDDIEWHFIGRIQSNKIKEIVRLFDWIQTVCSEKHLRMIDEFSREINKNTNICLQINIDKEESKSGLYEEELEELLKRSIEYKNINVRGIMAIPSKDNLDNRNYQSYELMRKYFEDLKGRYKHLDTLSIGMSNDYKIALAHGSNLIRIGSLIFGERK
tara:strand:+ start:18 stop:686 length:669 start_codon:yes stop_codon:yes gene_type:complete